jgi:hypothetical protein
MNSYETRTQYFYPNASGLVPGDVILGLGSLKIEGPLNVLDVEKNPAQVRANLRDSSGVEFWVTLMPTYEVNLKPPF